MRNPARIPLLAALLLAAAAATAAPAGVRTIVSLTGRDDSIPKLGLPSVRVELLGTAVPGAETLPADLAADLLRVTHVRPLDVRESGDYALEVVLSEPVSVGATLRLPFEARLLEPDGRVLWRTEGRTDVDEGRLDGAAFASLRRNVVSALVHDGWLATKDDPDHPPPPPPIVRRGDD